MRKKSKTNFVLIILMVFCVTVVSEGKQSKKNISVFPFNFKNSDEQKKQDQFIHVGIEGKLFKTGTYDLIDQERVALLAQIQKTSIFRKSSEKDSVKIGSFLSIDYIVMGDIINNRNLVIKLIDIDRKDVILTKIYDIDENKGISGLVDPVVSDINAKLQNYSFKPFNIYAKYSYFIPLNDLSGSVAHGQGGGAGIGYELPWIPNLVIGAEVQYFYSDSKTNVTHHATLMPMTTFVQYRFKISDFYAEPRLSFGLSYNALYYYENVSITEDYVKRASYDTTYKLGVNVGYSVNHLISVFSGVDYGSFWYKDRDNRFCIVNFGFNINY